MKTNSNTYPTIQRSLGCLLFPYNIITNEASLEKPISYDYDLVLIPEVEDLVKNYINVVQVLLDTTAQSRGYDNIISACTYAVSSITNFKAEGQACVEWRDAVWAKCYEILTDVQSGVRYPPTMDELLLELPEMVWS